MLSFFGGFAAIMIMMLVCLILLFVCWEELEGAYKLTVIFADFRMFLNIESSFLNIETRQNIEQLEAKNEQLERELSPNDRFPTAGNVGQTNKTKKTSENCNQRLFQRKRI